MSNIVDIPDYVRKNRRLKVLCASCVICLFVFVLGIVFHVIDINALNNSKLDQQYAQAASEVDDSSKVINRKMYAPNLVNLLGHTVPESIALIGDGAQQISVRAQNEQGSNVRSVVVLALTNESTDSTTTTPTVTLSLDADGKVIRAGFTTNMTLLGYGFLGYVEAVEKTYVVENTLKEAGLTIPKGSAVLPDSKNEYVNYESDGITVAQESYTFNGTQDQAGTSYLWESTITFDYSLSNARSNLAYTIRTISVSVATSR